MGLTSNRIQELNWNLPFLYSRIAGLRCHIALQFDVFQYHVKAYVTQMFQAQLLFDYSVNYER